MAFFKTSSLYAQTVVWENMAQSRFLTMPQRCLVMNKLVDFAGPLVFNGTAKLSVIRRGEKMNSGYISVHVFL